MGNGGQEGKPEVGVLEGGMTADSQFHLPNRILLFAPPPAKMQRWHHSPHLGPQEANGSQPRVRSDQYLPL